MSAGADRSGRGGHAVPLVVCAGGRARRWGGRDKTAVDLAGRPVLLVALTSAMAGLSAAGIRIDPVVVVADPGHPARAVVDEAVDTALGGGARWVREEPALGGPVAALAAGLAVVPADAVLLALAGDAPFAGWALPRLLAAVGDQASAAVGTDPDGVRQPLLAAYRARALREVLAALPGGPDGAALRDLLGVLHPVEVPVSAAEALDLDSPEDLARALAMHRGPGPPARGE